MDIEFSFGQGISEWAWSVDQAGAHMRELRARRLTRKARRRERTHGPDAGRWYIARADALRRGWTRHVDDCGTRVVAGCGCGHVVIPARCGVGWACPQCAKRRYGRTYGRAKDAARVISRIADARWRATWHGRGRPAPGTRPVLRMVTVTLRHSGSIHRDVRRIARAWHRWTSWLRTAVGYAVPYMRVREITPGRRGDGHVHYHVIMALPWVDFARARRRWAAALGQEDAQVDFGKKSITCAKASHYVAKYTAKGSIDDHWDPRLAARVVDATYGTRTWTTSQCVSRACAVGRADGATCRECGAAITAVPGRPTAEEYNAMLARRAALAHGNTTDGGVTG